MTYDRAQFQENATTRQQSSLEELKKMEQSAENFLSKASASAHVISVHADVLGSITDPALNLCLWRRPSQAAIAREVSRLPASQLRDVRRPTSLQTFSDDVSELLQRQGLDPSDFSNLRADLQGLAGYFHQISEGRDMKFRLFTTGRDDCRRFHLDRVNLRLLCTYRGPGTEWLSDDQVDRAAQARGAPNESIIRFGEPLRFKPFWVGIMRGDPDNCGRGLVHRSPPVASLGQTRVLFSLDC